MIAAMEVLADVQWMTLLAFLVDLSIKGAFICASAAGAALLLRRSTAFVRSVVWVCALVGLVLLPAFSAVSPMWNVPVIPDLASLSVGSYLPDSEKPESGATSAPIAPRVDAPETKGGSGAAAPLGLPWYAWGILLWIAGGLLYLCWNLISHAGVRSVVRRAVPADRRWTCLLDGMARELGLGRRVRLLESSRLNAAITVGILDPVIVLPSNCDDWPASRRRFVLSHELAHVQRWDTLAEVLVLLTTILHWFNPLVWHAVRRLRIERETDCDNAVLRTGAKPSEYAELLLNIAAGVNSSTNPAWQLSTISQGSNVKDRLMDILNQKVNRGRGSRRSAIVTGVMALALLIPISTSSLWTDASSQTDDKAKTKVEKQKADDDAKKAQKKAEWDAMSDEEKAKYKAEMKAKKASMTPQEKSAKMWESVCNNKNSAACIVGTDMKKGGVEAGLKVFQKLKGAPEGKFVFKEKEFNALGYAFLYLQKTDEAIAVFKLNVKEYPDSWNCYDSLGEAYMVAKNYEKSAWYYELALDKNPDSEHSKEQLEKIRVLIAEGN